MATLVSLRQEKRMYSGRETTTHGVVLADVDYYLFKAVLNSGLTPQIECGTPTVGSTITILEHQVMRKQSKDYSKGLIFIDKLSWKGAPNVPSKLTST